MADEYTYTVHETNDGRTIPIEDMYTRHLFNVRAKFMEALKKLRAQHAEQKEWEREEGFELEEGEDDDLGEQIKELSAKLRAVNKELRRRRAGQL